jgi:hypothetical protein
MVGATISLLLLCAAGLRRAGSMPWAPVAAVQSSLASTTWDHE